jgi:hypothetical protein
MKEFSFPAICVHVGVGLWWAFILWGTVEWNSTRWDQILLERARASEFLKIHVFLHLLGVIGYVLGAFGALFFSIWILISTSLVQGFVMSTIGTIIIVLPIIASAIRLIMNLRKAKLQQSRLSTNY